LIAHLDLQTTPRDDPPLSVERLPITRASVRMLRVRPEVHYARNGDTALAYQVVGDGPIDVAFVSGFVNNLDLAWEYPPYARFLRRLASFSRLILMDRRGTGLSDRFSPRDLPPLEVLQDDLRVVLNEIDVERPSLFGWSDAGCLCALFAATHPERTGALALLNTAAAGRQTDDFRTQWTDAEWDAYLVDLATGWGTRKYVEKVLPWFNPSLVGDSLAMDWYTRFSRQAASPNSAVAMERMFREIDVRAVLPLIQAPTLVMHRTDDQMEHVDAGRDMARRIPGARFLEFAGRDDAPWAGDQDVVLDAVEEFFTGARRGPLVDRALATVLFTDVVRSTALAAELGDVRWMDLLEEHHRRVRVELEIHSGVEVDSAGDGFLATFDGPARGVRCAQAIMDAIRPLGMEIRAGLHTGEIERTSDNVRGLAVHIGARVGSLAGPSEVLV
jgi:pimeloyl-ACP methyl ester carboxylesterase